MAESVNGGSNTPAQPPKEMSMEVRLLIAFLLMGVVMFVTPYFFKSQTPPPLKKDAAGQTASQSTPGAPPAPNPLLWAPLPSECRARIRHRDRPVQDRLQQSGWHGTQLAAQENQGQR